MQCLCPECIYREVLGLPFFHLEDVLLTGFAAQECRLPVLHHKGFRSEHTTVTDISGEHILMHYVNGRRVTECRQSEEIQSSQLFSSLRAKNHIYKVLQFNALQARFNALVGSVANSSGISADLLLPATIPPSEYFKDFDDMRGQRKRYYIQGDAVRIKKTRMTQPS